MKKLANLIIAMLLLSGSALAQDGLIEKVTLESSRALGGQMVEGTVWLAQPAPANGFEVELWADDGVRVPTRVIVPAGHKSVSFAVITPSGHKHPQIHVAALSPHSSAHAGLQIMRGETVVLSDPES